MSATPEILDAEQMKERYGSFYDSNSKEQLDRKKGPEQFWPMLPYAEFWRIADDLTRDILVEQTPQEV